MFVLELSYDRLSWTRVTQLNILNGCRDRVVETSIKAGIANDHKVVLSSVPPEGVDQGQHSFGPYLSN
jgi:hypothetical protein